MDDSKLRAAIPTLRLLLDLQAQILVVGHRGPLAGTRDDKWTLEPCGARLAELLNAEVFLPEETMGPLARKLFSELRPGSLVMLENLAFEPGEINGDEGFARTLLDGIDLYVADCLAGPPQLTSVGLMPKLSRDRTLGLRLESELVASNRVLRQSPADRVLVVGGEFLERSDLLTWALRNVRTVIAVGGVANTLLTARGTQLKRTEVDSAGLPEARAFLQRASHSGLRLLLPSDVQVVGKTVKENTSVRDVASIGADERVVDVGPATLAQAAELIAAARSVVLVGAAQAAPGFTAGTTQLLEQVAGCAGFSVIVNDVTLANCRRGELPVDGASTFVSTAGEAFVSVLCGKRNAALESLRAAD